MAPTMDPIVYEYKPYQERMFTARGHRSDELHWRDIYIRRRLPIDEVVFVQADPDTISTPSHSQPSESGQKAFYSIDDLGVVTWISEIEELIPQGRDLSILGERTSVQGLEVTMVEGLSLLKLYGVPST